MRLTALILFMLIGIPALAQGPNTTLPDSLPIITTGNAVVDGYINQAATAEGIDPLLIYAQIQQESSNRLRAKSPKGAKGLMQLMPGTARRFGVTNVYNPKQNVIAGVKYMRWLIDKFGNVELALAGYNAGEGAVIKYDNQIPPYRETKKYVRKIMAQYQILRLQQGQTASL